MRSIQRQNKAKHLLLTDFEFEEWWLQHGDAANFTIRACDICGATSKCSPFFSCKVHAVCSDCAAHAKDCNVSACACCPRTQAVLHVRCPECAQDWRVPEAERETAVCPCCASPSWRGTQLCRVFTRNGSYTNFLTEEEWFNLQRTYESNAFAVRCPQCGQSVERESACNELHHCGHGSVCAACGEFSFPWEQGLCEHRRSSCCPPCFEMDAFAQQVGERNALRQRLTHTLLQWRPLDSEREMEVASLMQE